MYLLLGCHVIEASSCITSCQKQLTHHAKHVASFHSWRLLRGLLHALFNYSNICPSSIFWKAINKIQYADIYTVLARKKHNNFSCCFSYKLDHTARGKILYMDPCWLHIQYYIHFIHEEDMQMKGWIRTTEKWIIDLSVRIMFHIFLAWVYIKQFWQSLSGVRTKQNKCLWLNPNCLFSLVLWLSSWRVVCHSMPVYALIKRQIAVVLSDLSYPSVLHLH